jgi:hypothetical protein
MDHQFLIEEFGEENHDLIAKKIKERSPSGFYVGGAW